MTDGVINKTRQRANGNFSFGNDQTRNVWENGQAGVTGNSGFGYSSFLLGQAQSLVVSATGNMRLGNHGMGFYAQDTWKVTRKLTVDYGLRYDFQTYLKEQYGRMQNANFDQMNTLVNRPGVVVYEGNGPGKCNCNFSNNYPQAFGPRLGVAYQINSKTVIRGGCGAAVRHDVEQQPVVAEHSGLLHVQRSGFWAERAAGRLGGRQSVPSGQSVR